MRKFITSSGELRARKEDIERFVSGETGSGAGGNVDKQVVETPVVEKRHRQRRYDLFKKCSRKCS